MINIVDVIYVMECHHLSHTEVDSIMENVPICGLIILIPFFPFISNNRLFSTFVPPQCTQLE